MLTLVLVGCKENGVAQPQPAITITVTTAPDAEKLAAQKVLIQFLDDQKEVCRLQAEAAKRRGQAFQELKKVAMQPAPTPAPPVVNQELAPTMVPISEPKSYGAMVGEVWAKVTPRKWFGNSEPPLPLDAPAPSPTPVVGTKQ